MNSFDFPIPTDHAPGGWHAAYAEVYEPLFKKFTDHDKSVRVLEIGTDGGGGLASYCHYFYNQDRKIYGVDISECPAWMVGHPRITHFQRDAYTEEFFQFLKSTHTFHIALDDGSHQLGHQEFFCQHYPHLLTQDGIAIVEDIAEHAHIAHLAKFVPPEFFCYGIDLTMHDGGRYDNRLMVIHRK